MGHVINLNKKTFKKATFQLLSKYPTPKIYNKHKLNEELESLFRLLSLKTHFKYNENTSGTTEKQIFKPQKKEKWTSNKNYHTVLENIEATQRELEKEQTKMKEKPCDNLTKNKRTSMKELSEQEILLSQKPMKMVL